MKGYNSVSEKQRVEQIIVELEQKGGTINDLENFKSQALDLVSRKASLISAMDEIADNIKKETEKILNKKNKDEISLVTSLSTGIYLPDFENGGYKLKIIGGNKSRDNDAKIDEETIFDVASITKLFTLILLFKLEEIGLINLDDRIVDINPDFPNLEDYTFNDLIRLHGVLRTDGNVAAASSEAEAYERLKTLYLETNDKTQNSYTDFGAIVISDTLEKVISKTLHRDLSFADIMDMYLLKPLGLEHTQFNPKTENVSGNGYDSKLVHDPKARILGGAVGSAGIFTNSDDLAMLSKNLYTINNVNQELFLSKKNLARLGEITFPNSKQSNKGNLGIYVKHPLGLAKTYTPSEFSTGSFSHQGWTGSLSTFDPNNQIHQSILVNAIYKDDDSDKVKNDKPVGFGLAFDEYLEKVTIDTMLMYLVKLYYTRYSNGKNIAVDVEETIKLK